MSLRRTTHDILLLRIAEVLQARIRNGLRRRRDGVLREGRHPPLVLPTVSPVSFITREPHPSVKPLARIPPAVGLGPARYEPANLAGDPAKFRPRAQRRDATVACKEAA